MAMTSPQPAGESLATLLMQPGCRDVRAHFRRQLWGSLEAKPLKASSGQLANHAVTRTDARHASFRGAREISDKASTVL
jgi:hypothetical protein